MNRYTEKNIFDGIELGDKFLTRDGRLAVYWRMVVYPEEYMCREFILENECIETDLYDGITLVGGVEKSSGTDIVSRYKEVIDEKKIDELATAELENINPMKALNKVEAFDWGFKHGFCRAERVYNKN